MIYITGDTHGEFGRLSKRKLKAKGYNIGLEDYVIVAGDLGLCWENKDNKTFKYNCEILSQKEYTILWVQGNHENYDMISEYPLEKWHGGNVRHIVRDKVILLERGQVFDIEGKKIFTFGGASSHDVSGGIFEQDDEYLDMKMKHAFIKGLSFRINHVSWWKEELPTREEMEEGRKNLAACDYKVDYVITHCCSGKLQDVIDEGPGHLYEHDILTDYFDELETKLEYKKWFFGHYHMDIDVDEKHSLLYQSIVPVCDMKTEGENTENIMKPISGRPRYKLSDKVIFKSNEKELEGIVYVVDAFGTFVQDSEPSYDIMVPDEKTLYKHVPESAVTGFVQ